ncbi:MAG: hypothetical protein L3J46_04885 [Kangiellaceae bacterium]|nr:hypothetical protein [Kangiellaceae bacterium]
MPLNTILLWVVLSKTAAVNLAACVRIVRITQDLTLTGAAEILKERDNNIPNYYHYPDSFYSVAIL